MDFSPNFVYSTKQIGGTRLVFEFSFRAGNLICASYVFIYGLFINLTVRVPKSLALEIDDGSGSMTVADVKGSVTMEDGSGSIDIDRVGKDVIIEESGSGGVHIGKVDGRVIRRDRDDDDEEDDEDDDD
jgi:hypothetical protein